MTCFCFTALVPLQSLLKSFSKMRDVGIVQVKVMRAEGLMAADVTGNPKNFLMCSSSCIPFRNTLFYCTLYCDSVTQVSSTVSQVKVIRSVCWS